MNQPRIFRSSTYLVFGVMLLLLTGGPVGAQNTVMEVDGDQTVNKTATVNENLKVNTASSPGTPNFITGNNGDAYIKDQLEVDGSVSVDGSVFRVNTSTDSVGVGSDPSSYGKFVVTNGPFSIGAISPPGDSDDFSKLYAKIVSGYAVNSRPRMSQS